MCLAIPGRVIEIKKNGKIILEYPKERREVDFSIININAGDYVLVSNKIILEKVPEEQALKFLKLVKN